MIPVGISNDLRPAFRPVPGAFENWRLPLCPQMFSWVSVLRVCFQFWPFSPWGGPVHPSPTTCFLLVIILPFPFLICAETEKFLVEPKFIKGISLLGITDSQQQANWGTRAGRILVKTQLVKSLFMGNINTINRKLTGHRLKQHIPLFQLRLKKFFFLVWTIFEVFIEFLSFFFYWISYSIVFVAYILVVRSWGMWVLAPQPGIELAPPALEDEIFTTGPPGKSPVEIFSLYAFFSPLPYFFEYPLPPIIRKHTLIKLLENTKKAQRRK